MTETELRDLVRSMRRAQRDYFRTRDRVVLDNARELERRVDAELEEEQRDLFAEPR